MPGDHHLLDSHIRLLWKIRLKHTEAVSLALDIKPLPIKPSQSVVTLNILLKFWINGFDSIIYPYIVYYSLSLPNASHSPTSLSLNTITWDSWGIMNIGLITLPYKKYGFQEQYLNPWGSVIPLPLLLCDLKHIINNLCFSIHL